MTYKIVHDSLKGDTVNRYRKGANVERDAVNAHIAHGAVFAGRLAGSKCKGKLKADVIAVYMHDEGGVNVGTIYFEQYKKGKAYVKKEEKMFYKVKFPSFLSVERSIVSVK